MQGHFCLGAFIVDEPLPMAAPMPTNDNFSQLVNLIGKVAHRTKPCSCWQGYKDGSYGSGDCVIIRDVTEYFIFVEWVFDGSHRESVLNRDWIDGNWAEYPTGWPKGRAQIRAAY